MWLILVHLTMGQALFESDVNGGSGNWNSASSWRLVSGSDNNGVPDSGDDVVILSGDRINVRNNQQANNLTIEGTLNYVRNRSVRIERNLTMSGNSAAVTGNGSGRLLQVSGDFEVPAESDVNINGQSVEVRGATSVDGTLNFLSSAGDKTFGDISVNATGNWNNTTVEDFIVHGSLRNNGIFQGCSDVTSCEYTFTSPEGTFSGERPITIPDIIIGRNSTYTNTTSVIVNDVLRGEGTFVNGTNARLELQTGGPFNIRHFDASAAPNTVIYTGVGSQPLFDATYHDIIIDKPSGIIDNNDVITVNNDLIVSSGNYEVNARMEVQGQVRVRGGRLRVNRELNLANDLTIEGGEFESNSGSARVNISGNLVMASGEFDQNNGSVTINTGDFIASGGNFIMTGGTVTVGNTYRIAGGLHDMNGGMFNTLNLDIAADQEIRIGNVAFTHTGNSSINGTVTVDAGGGLSTFRDITVNPGGVWDVRAAARFRINGNIVHNGASWTSCNFNGCEYTFTDTNATLRGTSPLNFSDVIVSDEASLTNLTKVTISDRLAGAGAFINGQDASLTYSGNNSSGGNFTVRDFLAAAVGNTVRYSRNGRQRLRATTAGGYFDVVVDMLAFGDLQLNRDVLITNSLNLNRGDIVLNNRRLIMEAGAVIAGGNEDSFIRINDRGVLRQNYTRFGETLSFPIGDNNEFSPITLFRLTAGAFALGAYVDFDITDANHPDRDRSNISQGGNDEGIPAIAFISRYWTLKSSGITGERFDATYQYLDADVTGIDANMVATLYRTIPQLGILDWQSAGIVTAGTNTVTLIGGDGFGDLYAMDDALTRLPITLISFDAMVNDMGVKINWVTASEENNALFTIERSENGIDFEPVLFLDGSGDSEDLMRYMLTDNMPPNGRVFYRLKQTDFNGLFSRSEIVSVVLPERTENPNEPLFKIYSNPVNPGSSVTIARAKQGEAILSISNIKGVEVFRRSIQANDSEEVTIQMNQRFPSGIYLIKLIQDGKREVKKLLVN